MPSLVAPLSILLVLAASGQAFIPIEIRPPPTGLDTRAWAPLTTLEPTALNSAPMAEGPIATPTPSTELHILPVLDANMVPDLKRQVTGQGPAAPPAPTQVSPVTTYFVQKMQGGKPVQVPVVYTQTFAQVPDQWPAPFSGAIGLGNIQGTIGVVKTKRSLPTQEPLAPATSGEQKQDAVEHDSDIGNAPAPGMAKGLLEFLQKMRPSSVNVPLEKERKIEPCQDLRESGAAHLENEGKKDEFPMPTPVSDSVEVTGSVDAANDGRKPNARTITLLVAGFLTMFFSLL